MVDNFALKALNNRKNRIASANQSGQNDTINTFKSNMNANNAAFDLGTAYDNNQKMKYRQQGIDALKPPDPFKLDMASIQSDPTYQAAMESARQATQVAEGNISSALNRRGIMDSTINANAASNAAQQEYGRVNRELLPQLIEDQYKRYMDQANMNRQYASDLFGVSDMYRADEQDALNRSVLEADILEVYIPPEARPLMDRLVTLKNNTEAMWSTLTPEQRQQARTTADQLRGQLQALNVDPALFGADVTAADALVNINRAGTPTFSARNQQFNQNMQQQQFDRGVLEADRAFDEETRRYNQEFEYTQGRDAVADARWEQEFQRILRQDGVDNALRWAANSISQQNANTSAYNASTSRMNADNSQLMDIWRATGFAPAGIQGVPEGTPYASASSSSTERAPTKNELEAEYYTMIDRIPQDKLSQFFKNEKAAIIADLGKSGYDSLKEAYNIFE